MPRAGARDRSASARDPLVALRTFDEVRDADAWAAADVPGSPFAVALDADGTVLAKGTFNTGAQLESVLAAAERRRGAVRVSERLRGRGSPGGDASRRGFLARVGAARDRRGRARDGRLAGRARRGRGVPLLRPHLHDRLLPAPDRPAADRLAAGCRCGAKDGRRWTTSAATIDEPAQPVDEDGRPLTDADGRAAARRHAARRSARRSASEYGFQTQIDGAWYRCCGGHVRKLVDCCGYSQQRASTATPR